MNTKVKDMNKDYLKKTAVSGLEKLERQDISREALKKILKVAYPLADLSYIYYDYEMNYDEIQDFFSESRKHGVDGSIDVAWGGSSSSSMLGLNPWETPIDVWMDLSGIPRKREDASDIFMAGHLMEPVYMTYFEKRFKDRYQVIRSDIQWKSLVYPHFLFNTDGLLIDKETGEIGILEIKHTGVNNSSMISSFRNNIVPKYYETQGRSYMEGLGVSFCVFCLGFGNRMTDIEICRIERDPKLGEEIMKGCESFIEDYVIKGVQPPITSIKDPDQAKKAIKDIYGDVDEEKEVMTLPDSFAKNIKELLEAKAIWEKKTEERKLAEKEEKEAKKSFDELTIPIITEMKTAGEAKIEIDGEVCKISRFGRRTVDTNKLLSEFPDVYKEVEKPGVDATKLKNDYPDVYNKCTVRATNGFSIK